MRAAERRETEPGDRVTNRSPRHRSAQTSWKTSRYARYSDTIATGNSSSRARTEEDFMAFEYQARRAEASANQRFERVKIV